jgi:hypothetical protein
VEQFWIAHCNQLKLEGQTRFSQTTVSVDEWSGSSRMKGISELANLQAATRKPLWIPKLCCWKKCIQQTRAIH